ncbi:PQQ-binding-like beta-propeller repeat protein [Phenylobacterium sp.]|jgi:quinoprotein glucose dehydrogenase|uniref:outer membrane protein assembly factor BamB family protein n=1 Tax=Phenylobacterium sp. TaxID=1871053 RepID=UPI0037834D33
MRGLLWLGSATAALILAAGAPAAAAPKKSDAAYMGGSKRLDRYSPLGQIHKGNVSQLRTLWTRPGLDPSLKAAFPDLTPSDYLRGTPILIDGVLYTPNAVGLVEAFDPATGATKWVQKPFANTLAEAAGQSARTVDYWENGSDKRIFSVRGEYLYALHARDGSPVADFGQGGRVSLNRNTPDDAKYFGFNGPLVVGDVIVIGGEGGGKAGGGYADGGNTKEASPEDIRGYDVRTGKLVWTFHILPRPGEPGYETWTPESAAYSGNMGAWAPLSADEANGIVYVPLSTTTNAYYGGHRPGDNLYSNSLVALNAKTGKLVWHYQMVHHDVWDSDNASPPTLADLKVDGRTVPAVIQPNKTGFLYVFNRLTGKPVWPIEERPVPASTIPGERLSPTQPFPTKPPPFDRQGIREDDLIDYTPALRAEAKAVLSQYNYGPLFTPPSLDESATGGKKGTLAMPGAWGSGNWNTGAFDPETGRYYAVSMTLPGTFGLAKLTGGGATIDYGYPPPPPGGRTGAIAIASPYGPGPDGLPLLKGPYGRITAYDMNRGDKLWTVANGDGPRNHPRLKDLNLPELGNTGRPVALVTKSLLFLGDASDSLFGQAGLRGAVKFRAFDKASGAKIWETPLPAGTTGGPITYMANGKQIVLIPVGGAGYGSGWVAMGLQ